jgi:hypothetical protein
MQAEMLETWKAKGRIEESFMISKFDSKVLMNCVDELSGRLMSMLIEQYKGAGRHLYTYIPSVSMSPRQASSCGI